MSEPRQSDTPRVDAVDRVKGITKRMHGYRKIASVLEAGMATLSETTANLARMNAEREAELATLRERLAAAEGDIPCCGELDSCRNRCVPLAVHWRERAKRAEALAAQNAKDAERYRWLRDESWKHDLWSVKYCVIAKKGDGLDAAIDAARKP